MYCKSSFLSFYKIEHSTEISMHLAFIITHSNAGSKASVSQWQLQKDRTKVLRPICCLLWLLLSFLNSRDMATRLSPTVQAYMKRETQESRPSMRNVFLITHALPQLLVVPKCLPCSPEGGGWRSGSDKPAQKALRVLRKVALKGSQHCKVTSSWKLGFHCCKVHQRKTSCSVVL